MEDIRTQIYHRTVYQCLKLLDPESAEYAKETSADSDNPLVLSANEESALGERVVQSVVSGTWPLRSLLIGVDGVPDAFPDLYPVIFIDLGMDSIMDDAGATDRATQLRDDNQLFELVILTVVYQEDNYNYANSNPLQLLRLRNQLDFVLNRQNFTSIHTLDADNILPSAVHNCYIRQTEPKMLNVVSPYDIIESSFVCEIDRQILLNP